MVRDKQAKSSYWEIDMIGQTQPGVGHYGPYGGRYVAETLMPALLELETAFVEAWCDPQFHDQFNRILSDYVGRPTPLYLADRLTEHCGGARIYLKREDLNHTGAHKVNNTVGQALLAKRMGKPRLIAETGAGMHGVATATVAALFGLKCDIFMGTEDIRRQQANVQRMHYLGARVVPVKCGSATLKDAMNEALRDWVTTVRETFYVIGSVAGPHPYPDMVKKFQSVIGREARQQIMQKENRLPRQIVACVGGGSNAIGIFEGFREDPEVALLGVEAGGLGLDTGRHAASIGGGRIGVLHGNKTYLLQDADGQIQISHSISAGLDYPGVGPEHAQLHDSGRAEYCCVDDHQAVAAFQTLCRLEGIIPALESAHAVAAAMERATRYDRQDSLVVNLSGRGDKDMASVAEYLNSDSDGLR